MPIYDWTEGIYEYTYWLINLHLRLEFILICYTKKKMLQLDHCHGIAVPICLI
jgi:hypothetical protein